LLGGTLKVLKQSEVFFIEKNIYNKPRSQNCENRLLASSCLFVYPSVRMEELSCHWTEFHVIFCLNIFPKSVDKIQISLKLTRITSTLHADRYTFLFISRSFLLRITNISSKIYREDPSTHFMLHICFSKIVFFMR